jgi:hypothetical protein
MPLESDRPQSLGDLIHRVSLPLARLQERFAPLSAFAERWERITGHSLSASPVLPQRPAESGNERPIAAAARPADIPALESPLSDGARAIAHVLCTATPARALTAKEIVTAAADLKPPDRYTLNEDVVRGRYFQELKPWGMESHKRRGYFIPPSRREALLKHLGCERSTAP